MTEELPITAAVEKRSRPRMQEAGLLLVILLIGVFLTLVGGNIQLRGGVTVNNFLRPDNLLTNVFTPMSWMAIMALGLTCVIIAGGIDISVGSIFGLAALGTAAVLQNFDVDAPAWKVLPVAFAVPLGIGLVCGLFNGALIVGLRMHPFIITLASMSIFRGICVVTVKLGSIPSGENILPEAFTKHFMLLSWKYTRTGANPVNLEYMPLVILLLVLAVGLVYLSFTIYGRENYAVGGNEEAARFSGIRVGWVKMRVYLISGLCAGIAAMVNVGKYGSASTATGETYELMVIAAAVVGGASLTGGRGTAIGAVLGAMIMQLIDNGLYVIKTVNLIFFSLSINKQYSKIIVGFAIIAAVAVDQLSQKLQERRLKQK